MPSIVTIQKGVMAPPTRPIRAEVLSLVRSSPAYIGAHDQAGWLGLFGTEHEVEDPVGWLPVSSAEPGALATFWDAFIEPNKIELTINEEWIDGFDVVRDVTIATTLPGGVTLFTPAHLLYRTAHEGFSLKVQHVAAHWETRPICRQLLRLDREHIGAVLSQGVHLVRTLGARPTLRLIATAARVGWRRKRIFRKALAAEGIADVTKLIAAGDSATASGTLDGSAVAVIAWFAPRSCTFSDLKVYSNLA